jgi:hypothetical protein
MSFMSMKSIFSLLAAFVMIFSCHAAETDWRQAARDYLIVQDFAPIEIGPFARALAQVR